MKKVILIGLLCLFTKPVLAEEDKTEKKTDKSDGIPFLVYRHDPTFKMPPMGSGKVGMWGNPESTTIKMDEIKDKVIQIRKNLCQTNKGGSFEFSFSAQAGILTVSTEGGIKAIVNCK